MNDFGLRRRGEMTRGRGSEPPKNGPDTLGIRVADGNADNAQPGQDRPAVTDRKEVAC